MPTPDQNGSLYDCLDLTSKKEIAISLQSSNFVRIYSVKLKKDWSKNFLLPELGTSSKVAMKEIARDVGHISSKDICKREYEHLKNLCHENIVVVYDICLTVNPEDPSSLPSYLMEIGECSLSFIICGKIAANSSYIVEHLADGSATDVENRYYTKDHLFTWLCQVAKGLNYLHENRFIHRDVKGSNVLLFNKKTLCKLCDFDTCREVDPSGMTPKVGTDRWRAPELRRQCSESEDSGTARACYNNSADCYSFGVLICEAVFREKPFSDYPDDAFMVRNEDIPERAPDATGAMRICKGEGCEPPKVVVDREKSVFTNLPDKVWQLLGRLLSWTPDQRPNVSAVLSVLRGLSRESGNLAKIVVTKEQLTDTGSRINTMVDSRRRNYLIRRVTYKTTIQELDHASEERILSVIRDFLGNINVKAAILNNSVGEVQHDFTFQRPGQLTHDIRSASKQLVEKVYEYCSNDRKHTDWMDEKFESDPSLGLRGVKFQVVPEVSLVEP